jgi:methionyl-tRNA formyltransferase
VRTDINFINTLKNLAPDLIVVVAYGQILPKEVLDIPRFGCINVHGSLLPKYRGAAPIQWAVINGDKATGITTMYMNEGMDTGDMILKRETVIDENDTAGTVFERLSSIGSDLLIETIKLVELGKAPRIPQDETNATKAPMLKKEIGCINWSKSALEIRNLIRGTNPWPTAYTFYKNEKFKIFNADIINSDNENAAPGTIINVTKDSIIVQTGHNELSINEIQTENGKRLDVKSYLVGHKIDIKEILHGDFDGNRS